MQLNNSPQINNSPFDIENYQFDIVDWTKKVNRLADNFEKSEDKCAPHLIERSSQIVNKAFAAQATATTNNRANQQAILASKRLLKCLKTSNNSPQDDRSVNTQENLDNAIKTIKNFKLYLEQNTTTTTTITTTTKPATTIPSPSQKSSNKTSTKSTKGKSSTHSTTKQSTKRWDKNSIKYLIKNDIHVDSKKRQGITPLAYAVEQGDVALVKFLLFKAHGDPNQMLGKVPLFIRAIEQEEKIALVFIKAGVNKFLTNSTGETALIVAIKCKAWKVAQALLSDPTVLLKIQLDPKPYLLAALRSGTDDILQSLLGAGISLKSKNLGNLLLLEAVELQNTTAVELLLQYDVNPNGQNEYGTRAISEAAHAGNLEIFNILVKAGADVSRLLETNEDKEISDLEALLNMGVPYYTNLVAFLGQKEKKQTLVHQEKHLVSTLLQACKLFNQPVVIKPRKKGLSQVLSLAGLNSKKSFSANAIEETQFWLEKLKEITFSFSQGHPVFLSFDDSAVISQALNMASKWHSHSTNDIVDCVQKGIPTCILSGYYSIAKSLSSQMVKINHPAVITTFGDFICICDRTRANKQIEIFRIHPKKFNNLIVRNLADAVHNCDKKEFKALLKKTLKDLTLPSTPLEMEIQKNFPLPVQQGVEGALENLEGSMWFLLTMMTLSKEGLLEAFENETAMDKKVLLERKIKQSLVFANQIFDSLLIFNQIQHLENYINPQTETRSRFSADHSLIQNAINVILKECGQKTISLDLHARILALNEEFQNSL